MNNLEKQRILQLLHDKFTIVNEIRHGRTIDPNISSLSSKNDDVTTVDILKEYFGTRDPLLGISKQSLLDIDHQDVYNPFMGATILMKACEVQDLSAVRWLLDHNADVRLRHLTTSHTALSLSCIRPILTQETVDIVQLLLNQLNINNTTSDGIIYNLPPLSTTIASIPLGILSVVNKDPLSQVNSLHALPYMYDVASVIDPNLLPVLAPSMLTPYICNVSIGTYSALSQHIKLMDVTDIYYSLQLLLYNTNIYTTYHLSISDLFLHILYIHLSIDDIENLLGLLLLRPQAQTFINSLDFRDMQSLLWGYFSHIVRAVSTSTQYKKLLQSIHGTLVCVYPRYDYALAPLGTKHTLNDDNNDDHHGGQQQQHGGTGGGGHTNNNNNNNDEHSSEHTTSKTATANSSDNRVINDSNTTGSISSLTTTPIHGNSSSLYSAVSQYMPSQITVSSLVHYSLTESQIVQIHVSESYYQQLYIFLRSKNPSIKAIKNCVVDINIHYIRQIYDPIALLFRYSQPRTNATFSILQLLLKHGFSYSSTQHQILSLFQLEQIGPDTFRYKYDIGPTQLAMEYAKQQQQQHQQQQLLTANSISQQPSLSSNASSVSNGLLTPTANGANSPDMGPISPTSVFSQHNNNTLQPSMTSSSINHSMVSFVGHGRSLFGGGTNTTNQPLMLPNSNTSEITSMLISTLVTYADKNPGHFMTCENTPLIRAAWFTSVLQHLIYNYNVDIKTIEYILTLTQQKSILPSILFHYFEPLILTVPFDRVIALNGLVYSHVYDHYMHLYSNNPNSINNGVIINIHLFNPTTNWGLAVRKAHIVRRTLLSLYGRLVTPLLHTFLYSLYPVISYHDMYDIVLYIKQIIATYHNNNTLYQVGSQNTLYNRIYTVLCYFEKHDIRHLRSITATPVPSPQAAYRQLLIDSNDKNNSTSSPLSHLTSSQQQQQSSNNNTVGTRRANAGYGTLGRQHNGNTSNHGQPMRVLSPHTPPQALISGHINTSYGHTHTILSDLSLYSSHLLHVFIVYGYADDPHADKLYQLLSSLYSSEIQQTQSTFLGLQRSQSTLHHSSSNIGSLLSHTPTHKNSIASSTAGTVTTTTTSDGLVRDTSQVSSSDLAGTSPRSVTSVSSVPRIGRYPSSSTSSCDNVTTNTTNTTTNSNNNNNLIQYDNIVYHWKDLLLNDPINILRMPSLYRSKRGIQVIIDYIKDEISYLPAYINTSLPCPPTAVLIATPQQQQGGGGSGTPTSTTASITGQQSQNTTTSVSSSSASSSNETTKLKNLTLGVNTDGTGSSSSTLQYTREPPLHAQIIHGILYNIYRWYTTDCYYIYFDLLYIIDEYIKVIRSSNVLISLTTFILNYNILQRNTHHNSSDPRSNPGSNSNSSGNNNSSSPGTNASSSSNQSQHNNNNNSEYIKQSRQHIISLANPIKFTYTLPTNPAYMSMYNGYDLHCKCLTYFKANSFAYNNFLLQSSSTIYGRNLLNIPALPNIHDSFEHHITPYDVPLEILFDPTTIIPQQIRYNRSISHSYSFTGSQSSTPMTSSSTAATPSYNHNNSSNMGISYYTSQQQHHCNTSLNPHQTNPILFKNPRFHTSSITHNPYDPIIYDAPMHTLRDNNNTVIVCPLHPRNDFTIRFSLSSYLHTIKLFSTFSNMINIEYLHSTNISPVTYSMPSHHLLQTIYSYLFHEMSHSQQLNCYNIHLYSPLFLPPQHTTGQISHIINSPLQLALASSPLYGNTPPHHSSSSSTTTTTDGTSITTPSSVALLSSTSSQSFIPSYSVLPSQIIVQDTDTAGAALSQQQQAANSTTTTTPINHKGGPSSSTLSNTTTLSSSSSPGQSSIHNLTNPNTQHPNVRTVLLSSSVETLGYLHSSSSIWDSLVYRLLCEIKTYQTPQPIPVNTMMAMLQDYMVYALSSPSAVTSPGAAITSQQNTPATSQKSSPTLLRTTSPHEPSSALSPSTPSINSSVTSSSTVHKLLPNNTAGTPSVQQQQQQQQQQIRQQPLIGPYVDLDEFKRYYAHHVNEYDRQVDYITFSQDNILLGILSLMLLYGQHVRDSPAIAYIQQNTILSYLYNIPNDISVYIHPAYLDSQIYSPCQLPPLQVSNDIHINKYNIYNNHDILLYSTPYPLTALHSTYYLSTSALSSNYKTPQAVLNALSSVSSSSTTSSTSSSLLQNKGSSSSSLPRQSLGTQPYTTPTFLTSHRFNSISNGKYLLRLLASSSSSVHNSSQSSSSSSPSPLGTLSPQEYIHRPTLLSQYIRLAQQILLSMDFALHPLYSTQTGPVTSTHTNSPPATTNISTTLSSQNIPTLLQRSNHLSTIATLLLSAFLPQLFKTQTLSPSMTSSASSSTGQFANSASSSSSVIAVPELPPHHNSNTSTSSTSSSSSSSSSSLSHELLLHHPQLKDKSKQQGGNNNNPNHGIPTQDATYSTILTDNNADIYHNAIVRSYELFHLYILTSTRYPIPSTLPLPSSSSSLSSPSSNWSISSNNIHQQYTSTLLSLSRNTTINTTLYSCLLRVITAHTQPEKISPNLLTLSAMSSHVNSLLTSAPITISSRTLITEYNTIYNNNPTLHYSLDKSLSTSSSSSSSYMNSNNTNTNSNILNINNLHILYNIIALLLSLGARCSVITLQQHHQRALLIKSLHLHIKGTPTQKSINIINNAYINSIQYQQYKQQLQQQKGGTGCGNQSRQGISQSAALSSKSKTVNLNTSSSSDSLLDDHSSDNHDTYNHYTSPQQSLPPQQYTLAPPEEQLHTVLNSPYGYIHKHDIKDDLSPLFLLDKYINTMMSFYLSFNLNSPFGYNNNIYPNITLALYNHYLPEIKQSLFVTNRHNVVYTPKVLSTMTLHEVLFNIPFYDAMIQRTLGPLLTASASAGAMNIGSASTSSSISSSSSTSLYKDINELMSSTSYHYDLGSLTRIISKARTTLHTKAKEALNGTNTGVGVGNSSSSSSNNTNQNGSTTTSVTSPTLTQLTLSRQNSSAYGGTNNTTTNNNTSSGIAGVSTPTASSGGRPSWSMGPGTPGSSLLGTSYGGQNTSSNTNTPPLNDTSYISSHIYNIEIATQYATTSLYSTTTAGQSSTSSATATTTATSSSSSPNGVIVSQTPSQQSQRYISGSSSGPGSSLSSTSSSTSSSSSSLAPGANPFLQPLDIGGHALVHYNPLVNKNTTTISNSGTTATTATTTTTTATTTTSGGQNSQQQQQQQHPQRSLCPSHIQVVNPLLLSKPTHLHDINIDYFTLLTGNSLLWYILYTVHSPLYQDIQTIILSKGYDNILQCNYNNELIIYHAILRRWNEHALLSLLLYTSPDHHQSNQLQSQQQYNNTTTNTNGSNSTSSTDTSSSSMLSSSSSSSSQQQQQQHPLSAFLLSQPTQLAPFLNPFSEIMDPQFIFDSLTSVNPELLSSIPSLQSSSSGISTSMSMSIPENAPLASSSSQTKNTSTTATTSQQQQRLILPLVTLHAIYPIYTCISALFLQYPTLRHLNEAFHKISRQSRQQFIRSDLYKLLQHCDVSGRSILHYIDGANTKYYAPTFVQFIEVLYEYKHFCEDHMM